MTEGTIVKGEKIFLIRNDEIVKRSVLASLRHEQEDVEEATKGSEFGAVFSPSIDFKLGDAIISYRDEKNGK